MAERASDPMSVDAFLAWAAEQEQRYELVDGLPIPNTGMAGARRGHDRVVANTLATIHAQLVGHPCEVFTADTAVVTPAGNVRLPDAGVDCGEASDDALEVDREDWAAALYGAGLRFGFRLRRVL